MRFSSIGISTSIGLFRGGKNEFSITPGVYAEYIVGGQFIRHYFEDGERVIVRKKVRKEPDYFGFKRLQFGLKGTITYKFLMLEGRYSFSPLFRSGQGPELREYSFGIGVNPGYWYRNK